MRKLSKSISIVLSLLLLFVIAACGSKEDPAATAAPVATATATDAPAIAEDTVRTFKHALGSVDIKGTPKRIVTIEWSYAEDLIALGIQPAGNADNKGYKLWVSAQPGLAAEVVDVGTRQEPNLEIITGLKPDLIITAVSRSKTNFEALQKIAPTIAFEAYPAEGAGDQYAEMEQTFRTIADIVGKKAEAEAVLTDLQKAYDDNKAKLKAANKEGAEFVLTQAYTQQNAAVLRLFTNNSTVVQILQKAGLKNAFESEKFEIYGFATASVESLPAVQDANFIYIVQEEDNVFEKQLKDNAVWNGLNFVKENRTFMLPGSTWTFGGPLSAKIFLELVTAQLTK